MNMSALVCNQSQPLLHIQHGGLDFHALRRHNVQKEKVVVVMGATGAGKSKLSIDLARRFPAEIVNSDKIQVYEGLDIVTNKITDEESYGIPHHLLSVIDPDSDFTAANFCSMTSVALESITGRGFLPIIVGGSNSFVDALVDKDREFSSRYECCFLWVDVSVSVLHSYISERVDRMVEKGLISEVRNIFNPNADYSKGIRKAIGVPELDLYFRAEPFLDQESRARLLEEAINEIKINTCKLACRQLEKIRRLKRVKGWKIHRLDATEAFRKKGFEAEDSWKSLVLAPSSGIVRNFLYNSEPMIYADEIRFRAAMGPAMAAATR